MSEIKLNTWVHGVIPELHPEAVIDVRHWTDKANSDLADRIRELEKTRDDYRRKWDEAVEEIRKLQEEVDAAEASSKQIAEDRDDLRTKLVESLMDRSRLMAELDQLAETRCKQTVECAVDDDGIETYRFETVTVMRRDGKEASCRHHKGTWVPAGSLTIGFGSSSREEAEEWCRQQLLPQWQPAKPEDVPRKPKCRVRAKGQLHWASGEYTLVLHDTEAIHGPWVSRSKEGYLSVWPICEVLDT